MTPEEISQATGLCLEEAELARQRDSDEPFWIEEDDPAKRERLQKEVERQGMRLTRGGRCLHVHGKSDKGKAAVYVRQRYERAVGDIRTAAVGDAANDLPMFMAVDRAYLVKGVDARHDPDIPREASIRFLPGVGPSGFFQAVEDLLNPRQEGWSQVAGSEEK
jgi:mannosyl-3-phosphoglycerate phosphatase